MKLYCNNSYWCSNVIWLPKKEKNMGKIEIFFSTIKTDMERWSQTFSNETSYNFGNSYN